MHNSQKKCKSILTIKMLTCIIYLTGKVNRLSRREGDYMGKVCILGSLNMDIVIKVNSMPKIGETIFGSSMRNVPGGKGANQAVAAGRSGAGVYMIGKVGSDINGDMLVKELVNDKINVDHVFYDNEEPTGVAIITVDDLANNSIIVVPGANMAITGEELNSAKETIGASNVLVAQFETSMDITTEAFSYAKECGVITLLNPAPAKTIPTELLKYTDIIVPNETETAELTGIKVGDITSARKAAEFFLEKGVKYVIITLGEKGAAIISDKESEIVPAFKVKAIDTTAAGDSFIGAVASKLEDSELSFETLRNAVLFGNKVSSIAVQREGAQPSIPTLEEVLSVYREG